jgi:sugar phosphate isomerase/epimerase
MQFGVCGDFKMMALAAKAGFQFGEESVGGLLKPREPRGAFLAALADVRSSGIPCPVVNCFVPGDLKITGPTVDQAALRAYVATTFERAQEAGVDTIVFGSGGARRIPDGYDEGAAHGQLVWFLTMLAPLAANRRVKVVIEPLHMKECNVLTTVRECAALAREVSHPNVGLLVDAFHHARDNDSFDDIAANGGLLAHVHIATNANRLAPGAEPHDFGRFFATLRQARYTGRVSIEAGIPDPEKTLPAALALMRSLAG